MELNDLIALVKAGYTKEEITGFGHISSSLTAETAAAAPTAAAADAVPAQEEPKPEPAPAPAPIVDNSEVLNAIKALTTTIQKNAILKDDMKVSNEESAVDILGSIINPKKK